MNNKWIFILSFGILFLLFVQSLATFIEGIYILELLSTSLDEKVLGILFLFSPVLLVFFGKRIPQWLIWMLFLLFFAGRGLLPYLDTFPRMISAGVSSGAGLLLIPIMLVTYPQSNQKDRWLIPAQGLALAVGLSVLLRTLNFTLDLSLTRDYGWIGWVLGATLGLTLSQYRWDSASEQQKSGKGITSAAIGVVGVLTLYFFMLSSPGVIARWTEGNYQLIIGSVSFFSLLWLYFSLTKSKWLLELGSGWLLLWNLIFTLSVVGTILAHTVSFPGEPGSSYVVVASPNLYQQIPLWIMLITFPVIFVDFSIFSGFLASVQPTPRKMMPGFLLGAILLVLLVFMNIFSNVWGYVEPISNFFRNKFWLSFLILLGLITLLVPLVVRKFERHITSEGKRAGFAWSGILLGTIFIATLLPALLTDRNLVETPPGGPIRVMTYNIQQANNEQGEKSYLEQLALISEVDPDIIGFQESDSTRISLGNNDYIRYFANQLGYYSYFGPMTVTGTYGTAILSKFPLENPRSVFSYSDQDEIGTAEAEIEVGGKEFTLFNVHPDGSDEAKMVFAETLIERANQKENVIALGDYNLRGWEAPYLLIDAHYKNAWMDIYPSGIDENGLDMSGRNRIDHIFVSPYLTVSEPVYRLPPDSWTDHPAHWADISW